MWRRFAPVALTSCALVLAGCSDGGGGEPVPAPQAGEGGGALVLALARPASTLDPLLAGERESRMMSRQVHEPLVDSPRAPFGRGRASRGLALAVEPSADRRVWRIRLRRGVRFQDGSPLNSGAVLVNATRWMTRGEGRRLLPGLAAVDAPRGTVVRLVFDRTRGDVPGRLSSPRLGIVSPRALEPPSGQAARLRTEAATGTGPFELRDLGGGRRVVLARNEEWWGSRFSLGPALDQVELRSVPSAAERIRLLRSGRVLAADGIGGRYAEAVRRDPLLTMVGEAGGSRLAMERSVRGLSGGVQSLAGVWLTRVPG